MPAQNQLDEWQDELTSPAFRRGVTKIVKSFLWRVNSTLQNEDVEDLVQEVLIKSVESLHKFRGDCKLFTWVFKRASWVFVNEGRKRSRQPANMINMHEDERASSEVQNLQDGNLLGARPDEILEAIETCRAIESGALFDLIEQRLREHGANPAYVDVLKWAIRYARIPSEEISGSCKDYVMTNTGIDEELYRKAIQTIRRAFKDLGISNIYHHIVK